MAQEELVVKIVSNNDFYEQLDNKIPRDLDGLDEGSQVSDDEWLDDMCDGCERRFDDRTSVLERGSSRYSYEHGISLCARLALASLVLTATFWIEKNLRVDSLDGVCLTGNYRCPITSRDVCDCRITDREDIPYAFERDLTRVLTVFVGIGYTSIILFSSDSSVQGEENLVSRTRNRDVHFVIPADERVVGEQSLGGFERLILSCIALCAAASITASFISMVNRENNQVQTLEEYLENLGAIFAKCMVMWFTSPVFF